MTTLGWLTITTPTTPSTAGHHRLDAVREDAVPIPRASSRLICTGCGKHPARRDVPLCSYCLYQE